MIGYSPFSLWEIVPTTIFCFTSLFIKWTEVEITNLKTKSENF